MPFWKKDKVPVISIHEAVSRGLISFTLAGAGGGDTTKVHLQIKNHSDTPVRIEIPRGTRFSHKKGGA